MTPSERTLMPQFTDRHHPFLYTTALTTLIRLGVDLDRVELLAVGMHEAYRGEIMTQEPAAGEEITPRTTIRLEVAFESAVDILPYQFFFGFDNSRDSSGEWEMDARRLMAPLDAAVIRRRGLEDFRRLSFTLAQSDRIQLKRLFDLFEFDSKLAGDSFRERALWVALLPLFHHWAGNGEMVARMIQAVFGYPCEIHESVKSSTAIPTSLQTRLGTSNNSLGYDMIAGESFTDCESAYRLVVSDVEPEKAGSWLPGKPQYEKLRALLTLCMPGYLDGTIRVRCRRTSFAAGPAKRTARLGYTTHL